MKYSRLKDEIYFPLLPTLLTGSGANPDFLFNGYRERFPPGLNVTGT
jgi:hypothetical protein